MTIDRADVRKVARLARIAVPDERLDGLAKELSGIMAWIEQLNEVDIEGVEAMTTPVKMALPMRKDEVTDGAIQAQVTANAPRAEDGFFVVPKVVE
jgi:aspartyl-tRNA(Asn)/glutamyl-tRNA(Gln) amidotransferase subunit C